MSTTELPAHEQNEDDLSTGERASEPGLPPDLTRFRPATRATARNTRRRGGDSAPLSPNSALQRFSLSAGPPVLPSALGAEASSDAPPTGGWRSWLPGFGFDLSRRPANRRDVWQSSATFAAFCVLLLLLANAAIVRHLGHATTTRHALFSLFLVLLIDVVLVTIALTKATNEVGRALALGAGGLVALVSAAFVVFGSRVGIATSVVALAVVVLEARERLHKVPEGAVHVVRRSSGRRRVLPSGVNLLLPGERVQATLSTLPSSFQTLPEHVTAPGGLAGEALLRVQYALDAMHAERAIAAARDWERALRRRSEQALRDELAAFLAESGSSSAPVQNVALIAATGDSAEQSNAPAAQVLQARIQARLTREAAAFGVNVLGVEVRQLLLSGAVWEYWRTAPVADGASKRALASSPAVSPGDAASPSASAAPTSSASPDAAAASADEPLREPEFPQPQATAQTYLEGVQERLVGLADGWRRFLAATPIPGGKPAALEPASVTPGPGSTASGPAMAHGDNSAAQPRPGPALSPRTLAAMYEAIQEQRVTDSDTIRHVAEALANYQPDPEAEQRLAFDPSEAANELRRLASQTTAPPAAEASAARDTAESFSEGTPTAERLAPPGDDDNILRGG